MKTIKFLLKSLFSNATVANEGKKQKWWLTFIILILSLGLAILPNILTESSKNGDQYITNYASYNVDYSLERFSVEYLNGDDAKIDLTIKDNKMTIGEKNFSTVEGAKSVKVGETDVYYISIKQNDNITMNIAYVGTLDFTAVENAIVINEKFTNTAEDGSVTYSSYSRNTYLLGENVMQLSIYPNNTVVALNEDGTALANTLSYSALYQGVYENVISQYKNLANLYNKNNPELISQNWKNFFTQGYAPLKTSNIMMGSIIYTGLNVVVIIIMSLTTFIMSRFKSALCDKLKFSQALQYVIYLSLCPALLTLLVHFIIPGMESMAFFTFLALRSIFFTTKFTRGEFSANKQGK